MKKDFPKKNPRRKKTRIIWRGFIYRLILLFFLAVFSYAGFIVYKIHNLEEKIYIQSSDTKNKNLKSSSFTEKTKNFLSGKTPELKGEDRDRINILLLGAGGEGHKGKYLTDTIMVASVNPQTYETAFLSIPRDLYVEVPDYEVKTKINAVFSYGLRNQSSSKGEAISLIKKSVENVTNQPIDYYLMLDFKGFEKIINELGGIQINVEKDIVDHRYPGPNHSYQTFKISKGSHQLDGETALKYARVRHTEGGDFARASRQQKVIAAAKRKAFSLNNFVDPRKINSLFDALGDNLITNVKISEVPSFLKLANNINIYNTTNRVLDAWSEDSLLAVDHVPMGGVNAFVLAPRIGNYSEIHDLAKNIFEIDKIKRQQESTKEENAKIELISSNHNNLIKARELLAKIDYNVEINEESETSCSNEVEIFNNNSNKMFTLNDLAKKFQTKVANKEMESEKDIIICLPEKKMDFLYHEEKTQNQEYPEEPPMIDENGKVFYNESKE
ncbi:MAG: LCP family protein [Candidatus Moraniibacteriota bacterium]